MFLVICTYWLGKVEPTNGHIDLSDLRDKIPEVGSSVYEPKRLRERHHLIIRLAVLGTLTRQEIANIVGCDYQMVRYTLDSRLGRERVDYLRGQLDGKALDLASEMMHLAPAALDVLEQVMFKSSDERLKLQAAKEILDRAGHGAVQRHKAEVRIIGDREVAEINRRALERARGAGLISEAVIIDESATP